jgi:hypothetical protein
MLEDMGFEVVNPNTEDTQKGIEEFKKKNGDDRTMEYFDSIIDTCDGLAFRSHPDLKIPSGVAYEVGYARRSLIKFIIELPTLTEGRILSVNDTREYLRLNGQR